MTFPSQLHELVTLVDEAVYDHQLRPELIENGVHLVEVDVSGVAGSADLFVAMRSAAGAPPDDADKWSSIQDDLLSAATANPPTALVVRHADTMTDRSLADLLELVDVLRSVAKSGSDTLIILTGDSASFPDG